MGKGARARPPVPACLNKLAELPLVKRVPAIGFRGSEETEERPGPSCQRFFAT